MNNNKKGVSQDEGVCALKIKVLLVEGNPVAAEVHRMYLRSFGCEVTLAGTGSAALALISHHFDIVFLDIGLPDIDGLEVCRLIRQQASLKRTPLIVLTANMAFAGACGDALTFDAVLAKPATISSLKNAVSWFCKLSNVIC